MDKKYAEFLTGLYNCMKEDLERNRKAYKCKNCVYKNIVNSLKKAWGDRIQ